LNGIQTVDGVHRIVRVVVELKYKVFILRIIFLNYFYIAFRFDTVDNDVVVVVELISRKTLVNMLIVTRIGIILDIGIGCVVLGIVV